MHMESLENILGVLFMIEMNFLRNFASLYLEDEKVYNNIVLENFQILTHQKIFPSKEFKRFTNNPENFWIFFWWITLRQQFAK